MHGTTSASPPAKGNVSHLRISRLTMEYIDATPERRAQIDAEVEALISGKIGVLALRSKP